MNKAKSILTVAALTMGLGIGFGVAFVPAQAQAQQGLVECAYDSQCDARCGGVGAGACHYGRCYCRY